MIRTLIKYTDDKIFLNDSEVFEISKTLNPGIYDMEFDNYGLFTNFKQLKSPRVFPLMPSSELKNIQNYVNTFFSEEYKSLCKTANILVKTGILLYGKQGIGKSNYINNMIFRSIDEQKACVFNIDSNRKLSSIVSKVKELRAIQNNLFVIVLEEVDELFSENGWSTEATLKNFMDGINSVDNLLFISSTNYLEKIPKSITERPSRFKKVLEIKPTDNTEDLKAWLGLTYKGFIPSLSEKECEHLHELCINKTIDEIKHVIIDYKMGIQTLESNRKLGFKAK